MSYISEDLVRVKRDDNGETLVLAWGDPVTVRGVAEGQTQVEVPNRGATPIRGTVKGKLKTQEEGVLKFAMVDVQQGDGMVLETPKGQIVLLDGGDNVLFARYCAARFRGSSATAPQEVAAIIVTHGDADHFDGLSDIVTSEQHDEPRKRLFLHPQRVFHNGLVKGPSSLPELESFGATLDMGKRKFVVALENDLRQVPVSRMNRPFQTWRKALQHWTTRGPIDVRRIAAGDDSAFDFLAREGCRVEVLGPQVDRVKAPGQSVPGLEFLHEPEPAVPLETAKSPAFSASHTINGHSIVLRVTFGNVRLLLSGDLNAEAMRRLRKQVSLDKLQAEILKVPHHGSGDFDADGLKAVNPVVSLISSGDENSRKEYIHPRANLMAALGRASRGDQPLVFCTELAAFFETRGPSKILKKDGSPTGPTYFGFERTNFGIIHVRTDGERVLVFTHSGQEQLKEAYRFNVDKNHQIKFVKVLKR
jgi:beta-lactamase superfamily II metal-dependent hydrolase